MPDMRAYYEWIVELELDSLKSYATTIEEAIGAKAGTFYDDFDEKAKYMTAEEREQFGDRVADEDWHLHEQYPALLWQTTFIATYSLLERSLLGLCELLENLQHLDLSLEDIKGQGIEAAQKYLKKVCRVPFPDANNPDWDAIQRARKIRNCFVHQLGQLKIPGSNRDNQLRSLVKSLSGKVDLRGDTQLVLRSGYCFEFMDIVSRFVKSVLKAVPDEMITTGTGRLRY
jgi:hypothetical protein